jgi:hypothetical protein
MYKLLSSKYWLPPTPPTHPNLRLVACQTWRLAPHPPAHQFSESKLYTPSRACGQPMYKLLFSKSWLPPTPPHTPIDDWVRVKHGASLPTRLLTNSVKASYTHLQGHVDNICINCYHQNLGFPPAPHTPQLTTGCRSNMAPPSPPAYSQTQ